MENTEFRNETEFQFVDISSEGWREYIFSDGASVRIDEPLKLHVGDTGHRVFDKSGVSHYIPESWVHLRWRAKDGEPNFVL
jgi:hypothetical protein